jgi:putative pyruvate formate lyase activating enzyme
MVMLKLLDGVIDIYMPDMKYGDPATARKYSKIRNYPQTNQAAVKEMHRQVGNLVLDDKGVAQRGLLVRHLVLPAGLAGTEEVVRFLAGEISTETYLNLMDQYRPAYKSHLYPEVNRGLRNEEFQSAVEAATAAGLNRLDQRKPKFWLNF